MREKNEIEKAEEQINGLIKLGEEIKNAMPYLLSINANLEWYNKVYKNIEDKRPELLEIIKCPLDNINSLEYSQFNLSFATGSTASFFTASADTKTIINSAGKEFEYLLNEYDNLNPINDTIENILNQLRNIDESLFKELEQVSKSYSEWNAGFRTNSDLAKDARTFQEHFKGYLNKLRVPKKNWATDKIPGKSWKKMVDEICKKGNGNKKAFMKQQKIDEEIWSKLTPVLKKTCEISKSEMDSLFKMYIEHVFSVINLIDEKILNQ